jgi:pilus assembly protein FimV
VSAADCTVSAGAAEATAVAEAEAVVETAAAADALGAAVPLADADAVCPDFEGDSDPAAACPAGATGAPDPFADDEAGGSAAAAVVPAAVAVAVAAGDPDGAAPFAAFAVSFAGTSPEAPPLCPHAASTTVAPIINAAAAQRTPDHG